MSEINFFLPKGPFPLNELLNKIPFKEKKVKISDIKTLDTATQKDITFFNSLDYKIFASKFAI